MSNDKMSPEKAIIILNQLNSDTRIQINRDDLKQAISVAKAAIYKTIPMRTLADSGNTYYRRCGCGARVAVIERYCIECGQKLTHLH